MNNDTMVRVVRPDGVVHVVDANSTKTLCGLGFTRRGEVSDKNILCPACKRLIWQRFLDNVAEIVITGYPINNQ